MTTLRRFGLFALLVASYGLTASSALGQTVPNVTGTPIASATPSAMTVDATVTFPAGTPGSTNVTINVTVVNTDKPLNSSNPIVTTVTRTVAAITGGTTAVSATCPAAAPGDIIYFSYEIIYSVNGTSHTAKGDSQYIVD